MLNHSDFQQVHDYSAGGVIALDVAGLIVYANPKAVKDFFPGSTVYIGRPAPRFFKGPVKPVLSDDEFALAGNSGAATTVLVSSAVFADEAQFSLTYWFIRNISAEEKGRSAGLFEYRYRRAVTGQGYQGCIDPNIPTHRS
jgi:hypothetical protein